MGYILSIRLAFRAVYNLQLDSDLVGSLDNLPRCRCSMVGSPRRELQGQATYHKEVELPNSLKGPSRVRGQKTQSPRIGRSSRRKSTPLFYC